MATQQNPQLTTQQKQVLFDKGTEAPFTGALLENKKTGMYTCANCGAVLFDSKHKFDSGSGWPSFYDLADSKAVVLTGDSSLGMARTEVTCATCGGHLGHLFHDAVNQPTGMRYCINSAAMDFKAQEKNA